MGGWRSSWTLPCSGTGRQKEGGLSGVPFRLGGVEIPRGWSDIHPEFGGAGSRQGKHSGNMGQALRRNHGRHVLLSFTES